MKNIFITIIFLFFFCAGYSQVKSKTTSSKQEVEVKSEKYDLGNIDLVAVLNLSVSYAKAAMQIKNSQGVIGKSNSEINSKSNKDVIEELSEIIQKPKPEDYFQSTQYPYLVDNKEFINMFLNDCSSFGKVRTQFYYRQNMFPIIFTKTENSELTFLVNCIAYDKILNTVETTPRKRASRVLTSMIIPSLKNFKSVFAIPPIKNVAITVVYECKNFLEDRKFALINDSESITAVFPKNLCVEFLSAKITEEELIKKSTFYIIDKDMEGNVKKVDIPIE
ncbi:hypothetical protein [Emticicia agri]|uniref:Uncharacterized protein n=1 Tax=Emticicia agri TaxID=2492393 RepID=A0A4Q5LZG9_9BACT|nr:hypothetical protein [Emticicia agri]RYU95311.1 hypothetical protein EWM59_12740 [Emticicia agri]